jgi:hypothetical protein
VNVEDKGMAKSLLSKREILDLDHDLIEAYAFFRELRERSDIAQLIHYPSIPAALSESLTIHCAGALFGETWTARLGVKRSDSDITLEGHGGPLAVEVKSTGQTNFQEFKSKDLDARFLVWIHFGDRYINGSGKVNIYVLENPRYYFPKPKRLKLRAFLKETKESPNLRHVEVESLQDLFDLNNLSENSSIR